MANSFNELKQPAIDRIILEKIRFGFGYQISELFLRSMTLEHIIDFETRALRARLETFLLGRKVREEVKEEMKIWDSWWDHLKGSVDLPLWLRRYFPARYHLLPIVANHYHLCPHIGQAFENNRKDEHFYFLEGLEPYDDGNEQTPTSEPSLPRPQDQGHDPGLQGGGLSPVSQTFCDLPFITAGTQTM